MFVNVLVHTHTHAFGYCMQCSRLEENSFSLFEEVNYVTLTRLVKAGKGISK